MLKIGLLFMDVDNIGDIVIYQTARYLVEKALAERNIKDYELVTIDIGSKNQRQYKMSFSEKLSFNRYRKKLDTKDLSRMPVEKQEKLLLKKWHVSKAYLNFKKNEMPKLEDVDMAIFCGGGLVKYHKQNFHYFINEVTLWADEKKVPVMINSVGVEGYDEEDVECQLLKKALNRDCVKYISTRDDFETLRNKFMVNENIEVEEVCDPALWSKDFYEAEADTASNKVGLGVIRPEIFKDYMYYVNKDYMADMYFALAKKVLDAGYQVEFFCNGLRKDADYIKFILKRYPSLVRDYGVTVAVPETTNDLVDIVSGYNRFLAVRLHASIIAASVGVPNVNLVWNIKQILFGRQTNTEQNYILKENFDEDYIFDMLMKAEKPVITAEFKNSVYNGIINFITKATEGKYDK